MPHLSDPTQRFDAVPLSLASPSETASTTSTIRRNPTRLVRMDRMINDVCNEQEREKTLFASSVRKYPKKMMNLERMRKYK